MPAKEAKWQVEETLVQDPTQSPQARLLPRQEPSRPIKSAALHVVANPKGQAVMQESPENPKNKRKLVKAADGEPKRTKVMSSAMPPIIVVEVCFASNFT